MPDTTQNGWSAPTDHLKFLWLTQERFVLSIAYSYNLHTGLVQVKTSNRAWKISIWRTPVPVKPEQVDNIKKIGLFVCSISIIQCYKHIKWLRILDSNMNLSFITSEMTKLFLLPEMKVTWHFFNDCAIFVDVAHTDPDSSIEFPGLLGIWHSEAHFLSGCSYMFCVFCKHTGFGILEVLGAL